MYSEKSPYNIVVARYKEDTSWLPSDDDLVKIYNKGPGGDLPNIGREAHTYLHYIVENYDNLPDVVFFTQGAPDHMVDRPIEYYTGISDTHSDNLLVTNGACCGFDDEGFLHTNEEHRHLYPASTNFYDWFSQNVDSELNIREELKWFWGATFSVKKEKILSRPRSYYIKLLDEFPPGESDPEIGHYFERSWYYIFNCHKN